MQESVQSEQHDSASKEPSHAGTVICRFGRNLVIEDNKQQLIHCSFRQNLGHIACGDRVIYQQTSEQEGVVSAVMDRQTLLTRATFGGEEKPLAANITQMVIVLAPQPEPSEYLVDQYLIAARRVGVPAVITINKADLLDEAETEALQKRFAHYELIDCPLIFISAHQQQGLKPLTDLLQHQVSILVGQSGVGKSSLTNALIPDLDLQTQKLSDKRQVGQHTTSASTLYDLPTGGRLIDSPGVRSFRPGKIDLQTLENGFADLAEFLGHCRFRDCSHTTEPDCALLKACESGAIHPKRLENFLHMKKELEST